MINNKELTKDGYIPVERSKEEQEKISQRVSQRRFIEDQVKHKTYPNFLMPIYPDDDDYMVNFKNTENEKLIRKTLLEGKNINNLQTFPFKMSYLDKPGELFQTDENIVDQGIKMLEKIPNFMEQQRVLREKERDMALPENLRPQMSYIPHPDAERFNWQLDDITPIESRDLKSLARDTFLRKEKEKKQSKKILDYVEKNRSNIFQEDTEDIRQMKSMNNLMLYDIGFAQAFIQDNQNRKSILDKILDNQNNLNTNRKVYKIQSTDIPEMVQYKQVINEHIQKTGMDPYLKMSFPLSDTGRSEFRQDMPLFVPRKIQMIEDIDPSKINLLGWDKKDADKLKSIFVKPKSKVEEENLKDWKEVMFLLGKNHEGMINHPYWDYHQGTKEQILTMGIGQNINTFEKFNRLNLGNSLKQKNVTDKKTFYENDIRKKADSLKEKYKNVPAVKQTELKEFTITDEDMRNINDELAERAYIHLKKEMKKLGINWDDLTRAEQAGFGELFFSFTEGLNLDPNKWPDTDKYKKKEKGHFRLLGSAIQHGDRSGAENQASRRGVPESRNQNTKTFFSNKIYKKSGYY